MDTVPGDRPFTTQHSTCYGRQTLHLKHSYYFVWLQRTEPIGGNYGEAGIASTCWEEFYNS